MSIQKEGFGTAEKYTIQGEGELSVSILTYGATIQAIRFQGVDVALGYDTLEEYRTNGGYLGATVGRYANRIAGGKFTLNGVEYDVGCNETGRGHLHGGVVGLNQKIWSVRAEDENTLRFSATMEDGEEGYPGKMEVAVVFSVQGNTLKITYLGESTKDTVYNPTNHCYFNLNGSGGAPVTNHTLQIDAGAYTPVDEVLIPTGELRPVAGTAFDFTLPKPIGQDIASADGQVAMCNGFDHNFCLDYEGFGPAATAVSPETGIRMECYTDCPGVQLYTGNHLEGCRGKNGVMKKYQGFCLETQTYPDAPNHSDFPSAVLRAGEPFFSVTEYRFSKEG